MTAEPPRADIDPFLKLDSRQLRHLIAVVDCKGFTAAAEQLNLTQPALSRSIQSLEERLGVRLIERTSKTFSLTSFGSVVVNRARLVQSELAQTLSEIHALQDGQAGRVSIGVGPSSVSYLAPAIDRFQRLRPNVKVEVRVGSMEVNYDSLLAGDLDVICTALNFPRNNMILTEKFTELRNTVFARRDHPLQFADNPQTARLLEYPWVFFANDAMGYQRVASYFAANQLEPPSISVETNTIETMFTLLSSGDYLASAPSIALDFASRLGIGEVKICGAFWSIDLGIAYKRSVHFPPAVTALISALKEELMPPSASGR